ncbi:DMT family transporter [Tabrizicola sp.]|uniref:DMT family transporter n=1 Tax=Tabrizicola sp. TaxID=2005166 RepID=UPI00260D6FAE|nr:DMT family transporter [Tabrizicola sp.]MDM7932644.1 DMT family transporter [Tabrizicola sp.]
MALTDNQRGALFMTASMAGFAVEDVFVKAAARSMPLGQVLLVIGLAGVVTFATMARRKGEAVLPAAFLSGPMLIRSGFEVVGRLFYGLAITLTALSTTSALLQATPLVVVAGAALVFGEKVGLQRWLAVLVGFAGVMVILRPGADFAMLSLLAVVGLLGFAGRDLATRAAPRGLSNRQLGCLGFAMLAVAGAILLAVSGGAVLPGPDGSLYLAGGAVFGMLGYHSLTYAMRTGEVSAVTPFRYTRLVFAMILAMALFGERPDAATWVGAGLIVGSGIFALTRTR